MRIHWNSFSKLSLFSYWWDESWWFIPNFRPIESKWSKSLIWPKWWFDGQKILWLLKHLLYSICDQIQGSLPIKARKTIVLQQLAFHLSCKTIHKSCRKETRRLCPNSPCWHGNPCFQRNLSSDKRWIWRNYDNKTHGFESWTSSELFHGWNSDTSLQQIDLWLW